MRLQMNGGAIRRLPALLGKLVLVLTLALTGGSTYLFLKFKPQLSHLRDAHFIMKKEIVASIDSEFLVNVTFDHPFQVRFKKEIPLNIPIRTKLNVPIDEVFHVPITDSFSVELDGLFSIEQGIQVDTDLPLETEVQTQIMGMDLRLPVKGIVPVNMTVPLKKEMGIKGRVLLHMTDPLPVRVRQTLEVPIDLVVKGILPVDEVITVPIETTMDSEISIRDPLPCTIELDVSTEDWGKGIRITG